MINTYPRDLKRRAFMLIESVLALATSSVIAAAVLMMLTSTSVAVERGTKIVDDALMVQRLTEVINQDIRCSHSILDHTEESLTLWAADTDGNGYPSISEILYYRWDSVTDELCRFSPIDDLEEAADVAIDDAVTVQANLDVALVSDALALGIESCVFSITDPVVDSHGIVTLRVMLSESVSHSMVVAVPRVRGNGNG